jgi:anti-sigma B factor antagonist
VPKEGSDGVRGTSGDGAAEPELGLSLSEVGEYAVISVTGEIDMYTAPQLREAVRQLSSEGRMRVAIDLTPTEFCDSTGLGVLIGARRRLSDSGGSLVVVCANPRIRKLLDLTGLDKVLDVREAVPGE